MVKWVQNRNRPLKGSLMLRGPEKGSSCGGGSQQDYSGLAKNKQIQEPLQHLVRIKSQQVRDGPNLDWVNMDSPPPTVEQKTQSRETS